VSISSNFLSSKSKQKSQVSVKPAQHAVFYLLDTALLEWVSELAVRAYTTPDSAVS